MRRLGKGADQGRSVSQGRDQSGLARCTYLYIADRWADQMGVDLYWDYFDIVYQGPGDLNRPGIFGPAFHVVRNPDRKGVSRFGGYPAGVSKRASRNRPGLGGAAV